MIAVRRLTAELLRRKYPLPEAESTANNLRNTLENTVSAESVIRDTDFASEIANFTKFQTQMQAGSTVLGNANQITQLVAGLLR